MPWKTFLTGVYALLCRTFDAPLWPTPGDRGMNKLKSTLPF